MSYRKSDQDLIQMLRAYNSRLEMLERRPAGSGGTTICDCEDGEQGPPGSQGIQGEQGEPGEQGIQGEPGGQGIQGVQGDPGADGDDGDDGAPGAPGADGGWGGAQTMPYNFSTTTTDSDPGAGNFRFNDANTQLVTVIRIDTTGADAAAYGPIIADMAASTNTVKGYLRVVSDADYSKFQLFQVTAVATPSGYYNVSVTLWQNGSQGAAAYLSNGEAAHLVFDRVGDEGDPGADGADGADGTTATSIVAFASLTSAGATGVSAQTDITGATVTFTAVAGRQYEITGTALAQKASGSPTRWALRLIRTSTVIAEDDTPVAAAGATGCTIVFVDTPGAGSVTYKLAFLPDAGTIDHVASATAPTIVLAKDLTGGATTGEITTASPLGAPGTPNLVRSYKGVMFMDTGNYWWPQGGAMEQIQWEWTHFFNNNAQKGELQSASTGTGADTAAGTAAAGAQGVLSMTTGTTSTGRASYSAGQSSALRGTADKLMHFHTRVRFPTLSTSGERYYFQTGYISSLTAAAGDGFYFRYDDSVSANWYAVVVNNTSGTAGVDTTIAVANNAFQKLRIEVDEPNVSAKFYIADALVATITTNFPGTTRDFGPGINLRKSAGSTARTCDVDYLGYWSLLTTTI